MAGAPPPYPPPYPPRDDWKYQRRIQRDAARAQRDAARLQWKIYRDRQRAQTRGYRSGSILGPLLLIGVGVVFLLIRIGHLDPSAVGFWYARWWPLLLLAGGAVLLAEWAFDYSRAATHPYYRRSHVGGGVIFLLILLCLPGIALRATHGDANWFSHGLSIDDDNLDQFLGDRHESDQTLDQAFPAGSSLTITNPHGDITLSGTSSDDQIHISVHKQVFSRSDSDATTKAARLAPILSTGSSTVSLTLPAIEGAHADLTITLPAGTPTTITSDHGKITANSLHAPLAITANHGDVEVNAISGPVDIHINNRDSSFNAQSIAGPLSLQGDCRDVDISDINGPVSLAGDFFGKSHFEHVTAPLRFHTSRTDFQLVRLDGEVDITRGQLTGDQIAGPVSLSARSYNVTLDKVSGDVTITTSDGSVELTSAPPIGNITINDRSGSVDVTLPEHANFTVQAETPDGDIDNEFGLQRADSGSTAKLSGTVGSGGPLLRINTTQDDISIKKGEIAPLPPPAPMPAPFPKPRTPTKPKAPTQPPPPTT